MSTDRFTVLSSPMSKRDPTRIRVSKVKKRRGVGSRTITVMESDDEAPLSTATKEYARVTKTRVSTSGRAEKVAMSSVSFSEMDQTTKRAPLEENINDSVDVVVENAIPAVPAKERKRANDSVSNTALHSPYVLLTTLQTKMYSWLDVRSTVLDEIVSLDGPGDHRVDLCSLCSNSSPTPLYRCLECSFSPLYCGECIVKLHKVLPLHRLEVRSRFIMCATTVKLIVPPALAEWVF